MTQVTAAAVFLGVTIAVAIALLELFRAAFNLAGSGFFDTFPLFPFTFPAAVLVQLCASRYDFAWAVNRRAVEGLGGIAMDRRHYLRSVRCRWRRSARTLAR